MLRDFHASLSVALPRAAVMMGSRNTASEGNDNLVLTTAPDAACR
jgi:hypothetical protein